MEEQKKYKNKNQVNYSVYSLAGFLGDLHLSRNFLELARIVSVWARVRVFVFAYTHACLYMNACVLEGTRLYTNRHGLSAATFLALKCVAKSSNDKLAY